MKKAGDILAELGFNANAPQGAQKAFLKNLTRAAYGAEVTTLAMEKEKRKPTPVSKDAKKIVNGEQQPTQLSFKFNE